MTHMTITFTELLEWTGWSRAPREKGRRWREETYKKGPAERMMKALQRKMYRDVCISLNLLFVCGREREKKGWGGAAIPIRFVADIPPRRARTSHKYVSETDECMQEHIAPQIKLKRDALESGLSRIRCYSLLAALMHHAQSLSHTHTYTQINTQALFVCVWWLITLNANNAAPAWAVDREGQRESWKKLPVHPIYDCALFLTLTPSICVGTVTEDIWTFSITRSRKAG